MAHKNLKFDIHSFYGDWDHDGCLHDNKLFSPEKRIKAIKHMVNQPHHPRIDIIPGTPTAKTVSYVKNILRSPKNQKHKDDWNWFFADSDKDGVMNGVDCEPYNKNKQDAFASLQSAGAALQNAGQDAMKFVGSTLQTMRPSNAMAYTVQNAMTPNPAAVQAITGSMRTPQQYNEVIRQNPLADPRVTTIGLPIERIRLMTPQQQVAAKAVPMGVYTETNAIQPNPNVLKENWVQPSPVKQSGPPKPWVEILGTNRAPIYAYANKELPMFKQERTVGQTINGQYINTRIDNGKTVVLPPQGPKTFPQRQEMPAYKQYVPREVNQQTGIGMQTTGTVVRTADNSTYGVYRNPATGQYVYGHMVNSPTVPNPTRAQQISSMTGRQLR